VDITYKLLYNDAVAMTGGQHAEGRIAVPELTRLLALEGVRRVIVTTPEPRRYRRIPLIRSPRSAIATSSRPPCASSRPPAASPCSSTTTSAQPSCAGFVGGQPARADEPVWINERVCEGCGDCGEKSTCLSVVPVETEFGRKTTIRQGSCNSDLSCLRATVRPSSW